MAAIEVGDAQRVKFEKFLSDPRSPQVSKLLKVAVAAAELKKNGKFKLSGVLNMKLKKKITKKKKNTTKLSMKKLRMNTRKLTALNSLAVMMKMVSSILRNYMTILTKFFI